MQGNPFTTIRNIHCKISSINVLHCDPRDTLWLYFLIYSSFFIYLPLPADHVFLSISYISHKLLSTALKGRELVTFNHARNIGVQITLKSWSVSCGRCVTAVPLHPQIELSLYDLWNKTEQFWREADRLTSTTDIYPCVDELHGCQNIQLLPLGWKWLSSNLQLGSSSGKVT